MNKVTIGIISAVVVLLLGGVLLTMSSDDDEQANTTPSSQVQDEGSMNESTAEPAIELESSGSSVIEDYSPEALAASETEANLLFFHAAWCTVCNAVERNIEAGTIPDSLTIFKVDYESPEGQALADTYNIPIQYTMVQVDTEGREVTQWVNNFSDGVNEIVAQLQ